MKKVKDTGLKKNKSSLNNVKEGIVKRKKDKKGKNPKGLNRIEKANLPAQNSAVNLQNPQSNADAKIKRNKKKKQGNQQERLEPGEAATIVVRELKDKKQKHSVDNQPKLVDGPTTTPPKEITEAERIKIQKKKTKKLAQLMKKQNRRAENKDQTLSTVATATAPKSTDTINSKVLSKKDKKARKRQLIRDNKLAEKQIRDPAVEAATVFVGNLPVTTKRIQLIHIFKDIGPVSTIRIRTAGGKVIYKHKLRKTAGSLNAYVVFKDKEIAEKALSLNGIEFKGNHLRITLMENNSTTYKDEGKRTVFVGNLKYSATEESLREIFSNCGEIEYVRCIRDGDKGCKGIAYVCFKTADAVSLALELNKTIVDERPINVERFSTKKLGAKAAREAQQEKEKLKKPISKEISNKKGKLGQKKENSLDVDASKKTKKSEFRGVKVEGLKKKQKSKKKKSNDKMLQLAKKIAPRVKSE